MKCEISKIPGKPTLSPSSSQISLMELWSGLNQVLYHQIPLQLFVHGGSIKLKHPHTTDALSFLNHHDTLQLRFSWNSLKPRGLIQTTTNWCVHILLAIKCISIVRFRLLAHKHGFPNFPCQWTLVVWALNWPNPRLNKVNKVIGTNHNCDLFGSQSYTSADLWHQWLLVDLLGQRVCRLSRSPWALWLVKVIGV